MKRRVLIGLMALGLLLSVAAGPATAAPGGPDRYQSTATAYTVAVLNTYIHNFMVTVNPCDGTIIITGSTPGGSWYYTTETVTGTLASGVITFQSKYNGPYNPGYTWSGSFPVAGGALSGQYTGTVTKGSMTSSTYKSHGDFVSSMGGGSDAAHSCIGMPIHR